MEKYTNEYNKECYRGVMPETPFSELEFHEVLGPIEIPKYWELHTNLGSLTVLHRTTEFDGGIRDTVIVTYYICPNGRQWLAVSMQDVRQSGATTMQDAIDWVKEKSNICAGE